MHMGMAGEGTGYWNIRFMRPLQVWEVESVDNFFVLLHTIFPSGWGEYSMYWRFLRKKGLRLVHSRGSWKVFNGWISMEEYLVSKVAVFGGQLLWVSFWQLTTWGKTKKRSNYGQMLHVLGLWWDCKLSPITLCLIKTLLAISFVFILGVLGDASDCDGRIC